MTADFPDRLPSRCDGDRPLLRATYGPDDAVLRDGKVMVRSAIFLSTAVTGDPVSVFVVYLPADDVLAQTAAAFGPLDPDETDDEEPAS